MLLNVSQVLEYQVCPRKWAAKYIHLRGTEPSPALSDGTYWHKLAEAWLKGDPLLPTAEGTVQDRMRQFVEDGRLPKYPVVGTEVRLEMPLGRHTLVGALDGIMPAGVGGSGNTHFNTFYSLQWKTCAGGQDLERQCDAVQYSYHESAYEALMNHAGYPCAGTMLGVYKKLTLKELAAGVEPYSAHILERPPGYVAGIMEELEEIADKMEAEGAKAAAGNLLTPCRKNCILGFARCQYWATCYGGVPLSDMRYTDLEVRYPPEEAP